MGDGDDGNAESALIKHGVTDASAEDGRDEERRGKQREMKRDGEKRQRHRRGLRLVNQGDKGQRVIKFQPSSLICGEGSVLVCVEDEHLERSLGSWSQGPAGVDPYLWFPSSLTHGSPIPLEVTCQCCICHLQRQHAKWMWAEMWLAERGTSRSTRTFSECGRPLFHSLLCFPQRHSFLLSFVFLELL